jgi:hypothetical protein
MCSASFQGCGASLVGLTCLGCVNALAPTTPINRAQNCLDSERRCGWNLGSRQRRHLRHHGGVEQGHGIYLVARTSTKGEPGGQIRDIANVGNFDFDWTNDHFNLAPRDFPDANPYAVLALPDRLYVADAGANTLNLVRPNGSDQILAYFPNNVIADATPTCIAKGPDGALYIGTLALVDSLVFGPSAIVYRVDPTRRVLATSLRRSAPNWLGVDFWQG